jgi:hypothetical protein
MLISAGWARPAALAMGQDGVIRLGRVALGIYGGERCDGPRLAMRAESPFGGTQLQLYGVILSFGPADLMQLSARNPIEVDNAGWNEPMSHPR